MKTYTMPTFVLLATSGLLLFGMLKSFGRASQAAIDLATERNTVATASRRLASTQHSAQTAKTKSATADKFLEVWTPELSSEANIEQIFGRLDTLAVNNLLSPSGKNFALNTNYFFDGRHLPVQNVNISVAGDYYRTLNWLGAVENAFPLARVEQISYTTNGSSLSLAVQFVFPRKFDSK
jgi:hypothetical protein